MRYITVADILNEDNKRHSHGYHVEHSHHQVDVGNLLSELCSVLNIDKQEKDVDYALELKAFCHTHKTTYGKPPGNNQNLLDNYPISLYLKHVNWHGKYDKIKPCNIQLLTLNLTNGGGSYYDYGSHNCIVSFNYKGEEIVVRTWFKIAENLFNLTIQDDGTISQTWHADEVVYTHSFKFDIGKVIDISRMPNDYRKNTDNKFNFTFESLPAIGHFSDKVENLNSLLRVILSHKEDDSPGTVDEILTGIRNGRKIMPVIDLGWPKLDGIKKTFDKVYPIAEKLKIKDPYTYMAFRSLVFNAKRSIDGVGLPTVFNNIFANVTTEEEMQETLTAFPLMMLVRIYLSSKRNAKRY